MVRRVLSRPFTVVGSFAWVLSMLSAAFLWPAQASAMCPSMPSESESVLHGRESTDRRRKGSFHASRVQWCRENTEEVLVVCS